MNTAFKFAEGAGQVLIGRHELLGGLDCEQVFKDAGLLAIDGIAWDADMSVIRSALVNKKRAFKAPFIEHEPSEAVSDELHRLGDHARRLFAELYPTFTATEVRTSFRPMITGPEPLHFDSYGGESPMVTAYINVSDEPRVYGIGPNFPTLVETQPMFMHSLAKDVGMDLSYALRQRTASGLGPLGPDAPRHRVEFAPGAIWFFNAKTVSHEVIHGTGAFGISWEVPGCGAPMQADLLEKLA
ncbi:MAG TPA: hypothetical protein VNU48_00420 [Burkholderiaceae bacterium]|nr:hypothetical protein [Burkholderiaceae bacterium]